jgi:hypothetical protein
MEALMAMAMKLAILGGILLGVVGLAAAVGHTAPGAARRSLARLGATTFFAFLASFFWLSPFTERGGFLTGMAVFFAIGGTISAWKLASGLRAGAASEKSATH